MARFFYCQPVCGAMMVKKKKSYMSKFGTTARYFMLFLSPMSKHEEFGLNWSYSLDFVQLTLREDDSEYNRTENTIIISCLRPMRSLKRIHKVQLTLDCFTLYINHENFSSSSTSTNAASFVLGNKMILISFPFPLHLLAKKTLYRS